MIDGIGIGDPTFGATGDIAKQSLDKDAFMQLLVAQMRNQDPMAPVDNQEFIAQLAQFSSLEEMQGVNENLVALALLQESNALLNQLTSSSDLIGKRVVYTDPTTSVTPESGTSVPSMFRMTAPSVSFTDCTEPSIGWPVVGSV